MQNFDFVVLLFRIAGDTALCKNIHESVSRQMRKNFAKSKWRVSRIDIVNKACNFIQVKSNFETKSSL